MSGKVRLLCTRARMQTFLYPQISFSLWIHSLFNKIHIYNQRIIVPHIGKVSSCIVNTFSLAEKDIEVLHSIFNLCTSRVIIILLSSISWLLRSCGIYIKG